MISGKKVVSMPKSFVVEHTYLGFVCFLEYQAGNLGIWMFDLASP